MVLFLNFIGYQYHILNIILNYIYLNDPEENTLETKIRKTVKLYTFGFKLAVFGKMKMLAFRDIA